MLGGAGAVEEHLVEVAAAGHHVDRPHGDAGLVHRHAAACVMPRCRACVGVGAGEQEHPVGGARVGRPDLLAVDDPLAVLEPGAGAQPREVRAGVRLGEALAPAVLAADDARQEALFCSAVPCRTSRLPIILMLKLSLSPLNGTPARGELLDEDDLLQSRQPGAAVLARPARRQLAARGQPFAPPRGELLGRVSSSAPSPAQSSGSSRAGTSRISCRNCTTSGG